MDGSSQLSLGGMCYPGRSIDVPDTATRAGPHNGNAGRTADPPHGPEVGEGVPERTTRMHTPCRETMGQNTDRAGSFGDSFVDLNAKAPRGRFRRGGGTPPRKNRADKTVRGRRDPSTKAGSNQAEDHHRYI